MAKKKLTWIGKIRLIPPVAQIAQSVEQRIENPRVGGSIPPLGTTLQNPGFYPGFLIFCSFDIFLVTSKVVDVSRKLSAFS